MNKNIVARTVGIPFNGCFAWKSTDIVSVKDP